MTEKQRLAKAEEMAAAAAAEAKRAKERLAAEQAAINHGTAAAVDLSDPVPSVPSVASSVPPQAAVTQPAVSDVAASSSNNATQATQASTQAAAAAEANMRSAATAAFTKAIADGLSKDEARDVARKAGKAAFKATMKALKPAATPKPVEAQEEEEQASEGLQGWSVVPKPAPPPLLYAVPPAASATAAAVPPADAAKETPGFVSEASRMRVLTPEEKAAEAEAKAREMAERAERQLKIASDAKKSRGGSRGNSTRL